MILEFVAQDFQCDVGMSVLCLLAQAVTGFEYLAHAAAAQLLDQLVSSADHRADPQHHAGLLCADFGDLGAVELRTLDRGSGSGRGAPRLQDQRLRRAPGIGGRAFAGRIEDSRVSRFDVEKRRRQVIVKNALQ